MDFNVEHEKNRAAHLAGEITNEQFLARVEEIIVAETTYLIDCSIVEELCTSMVSTEAVKAQVTEPEWKCGYPLNPRKWR